MNPILFQKIDPFRAGHYGITPEDLDFVPNHGIKYHLGRGTKASEG
jgi:hypothetical protein